MVYQRGNQREGSPHYVFLYSEDDDSGDENIPLQSRIRSTSTPRKVEVINIQLKSDDTLQALALRYRCTISELKRINKIHKENEIFARRSIKVPVHPFSILTETEQLDGADVPTSREETLTGTEHLINFVSPSVVVEPPKAEINAIILNSVCEPLSSYNNTNTEADNSECDHLIAPIETHKIESHVTETLRCSGDDCGLSWTQLLGFSLLLGFAGPIIYILYIASHSSKTHSDTSH